MLCRKLTLFALLAAAIVLYPAFTFFYASGAPAAHTGAPTPEGGTEGVCRDCHTGNVLNSPGGSVTVEAPEEYTPGTPVKLTVLVQRTGMEIAGFELTVKSAANETVGTFELTDSVALARKEGGVKDPGYVTHTEPREDGTWTFEWVPPSTSVGDVTVYVAGNAANGNGINTGDFIYTSNKQIRAGTSTDSEEEQGPLAVSLGSAFPNPFRSRTVLPYTLREGGRPVTLTVYDVAGRKLSTRSLGAVSAGTHEAEIRAGDWPDGIYFVELSTPSGRSTRAVLLAR